MFSKCLEAPYLHTNNSADYYIERQGNEMTVYFESSNGEEDWKNNLDFPITPYKNMDRGIWLAHRGFFRVWSSIKDEIADILLDREIKRITEVGYSHGAALATLCHEFVSYNRPDLYYSHTGFGFGAPRVLWGIKTRATEERFHGFTVIRNIDDIVTHLPPKLLGFYHVGKMMSIGKAGKYSRIDAHRPESYIAELRGL